MLSHYGSCYCRFAYDGNETEMEVPMSKLVVAAVLTAISAFAQWLNYPTVGVPKSADG